MRLSTVQIYQQGINAIIDQQNKLTRTQLQIATGQRINTPSDDPSGAVRLLDMSEELSKVSQYQRNSELAQSQLQTEEDALTGVGNELQRFRELVVQANNDVLSADQRGSIATELRQIQKQVLALANSRDVNGDYLFAGYQVTNTPFSLAGGSTNYSGDQGQRYAQIGPSTQVPMGDSGADVFMRISEGNGFFKADVNPANSGTVVIGSTSRDGLFVDDQYTVAFNQATPSDPITYQVVGAASGVVASGNFIEGDGISFNGARINLTGVPANGDTIDVAPSGNRDIFTVMENIITALENPTSTASETAHFHNTVNRGLEGLDSTIDRVLEVRANIGVRLNNIESQRNINEDYQLQLQNMESSLKDLDMATAISDLNLQQVALQAAQQSYVQVQRLSLFQML
ncbi:flagellar hook-associated protein FlgL [Porticoccaceae bacterium LTM1]|nr:flagellar hook-associated protein FlgL [Porticoccaceae bacterium LTM1]